MEASSGGAAVKTEAAANAARAQGDRDPQSAQAPIPAPRAAQAPAAPAGASGAEGSGASGGKRRKRNLPDGSPASPRRLRKGTDEAEGAAGPAAPFAQPRAALSDAVSALCSLAAAAPPPPPPPPPPPAGRSPQATRSLPAANMPPAVLFAPHPAALHSAGPPPAHSLPPFLGSPPGVHQSLPHVSSLNLPTPAAKALLAPHPARAAAAAHPGPAAAAGSLAHAVTDPKVSSRILSELEAHRARVEAMAKAGPPAPPSLPERSRSLREELVRIQEESRRFVSTLSSHSSPPGTPNGPTAPPPLAFVPPPALALAPPAPAPPAPAPPPPPNFPRISAPGAAHEHRPSSHRHRHSHSHSRTPPAAASEARQGGEAHRGAPPVPGHGHRHAPAAPGGNARRVMPAAPAPPPPPPPAPWAPAAPPAEGASPRAGSTSFREYAVRIRNVLCRVQQARSQIQARSRGGPAGPAPRQPPEAGHPPLALDPAAPAFGPAFG